MGADYRAGDWPPGEPFHTDEERAAIAKTFVPEPEPAPIPPNWGPKTKNRDAWLDSDAPRKPVNKQRGARFSFLVSDEMLADRIMGE